MALLGSQLEFIFEGFQRGGLRHGVGHIEVTGHTTIGSSAALTLDICLVCQSGLTEMNVVVDDTGQYKAPSSIDNVV